jgi:multidrug efflux pump subunit AcrB
MQGLIYCVAIGVIGVMDLFMKNSIKLINRAQKEKRAGKTRKLEVLYPCPGRSRDDKTGITTIKRPTGSSADRTRM